MIEEADGDVEINRDQVRAHFAELDGLRRALGRSTMRRSTRCFPSAATITGN